tara:strand:+ start:302 stop:625 length:324 start_codon:yes stop_codon:yes gene_type:complete
MNLFNRVVDAIRGDERLKTHIVYLNGSVLHANYTPSEFGVCLSFYSFGEHPKFTGYELSGVEDVHIRVLNSRGVTIKHGLYRAVAQGYTMLSKTLVVCSVTYRGVDK